MAAGGVRLTYLELTGVSHFPWALGQLSENWSVEPAPGSVGPTGAWLTSAAFVFLHMALLIAYCSSACKSCLGLQSILWCWNTFCDLTLSACWFPVWSLVAGDYTRNVLYKEPLNVQSASGDSHLEQHWIPHSGGSRGGELLMSLLPALSGLGAPAPLLFALLFGGFIFLTKGTETWLVSRVNCWKKDEKRVCWPFFAINWWFVKCIEVILWILKLMR